MFLFIIRVYHAIRLRFVFLGVYIGIKINFIKWFNFCVMQFKSTAEKRNITGKIKQKRKGMEVKMLYLK